jgi:tetratricopeptide (TPR) repeat protein
VKLPAGLFEYVEEQISGYPRDQHSECYALTSYPRLFKEGCKKYNERSFDQAFRHFEKALELQPQDAAALIGKAWTSLNLRSEKDLTVQFAFLRIPDPAHLSSPEYPKEWIDGTLSQHLKALKDFYNYCQVLYAKNAFEEVLDLLQCHSALLGEKVLFLELKFKCLWELNKSSQILWECGEMLKAYVSDSNIAEQKLSEKEKLVVQDSCSRHFELLT